MEAQLRRGILDACVLAVLERGESYGYKLVTDINTLYPILKRLESSNMLTVRTMEYNGRLRKYYSITDTGRNRVTELLSEWEEIDKVYRYIIEERGENRE